jgi:EAL domain-containing protein (putative c-di-GMP-specific phosphodiesterase class I)
MAETSTAVSLIQTETSNEDGVLQDHLQRIENNAKGCYVVQVNLSQLRPEYQKQHFLRIAARTFDPLVNNFDVTLYLISNGDLVLMCRETPIDEVDQPINRIRNLFSEDPLTFGEVGSPDARFTSWHDLSHVEEYKAFVAAIDDMAGAARERRRSARTRGVDDRDPLEPNNLGDINDRIRDVRINDLIRRQSAVTIKGGKPDSVLYSEFLIAMGELQQRAAPGVNLFSNTWMFQYLTETLDRRMLSVLMAQNLAILTDPISINLNIATILSPGFQSFHESAGASAKNIIIEMQTIDIFANMTAYENASAWLHQRGYRVLLDGLNPLSLSFFDPSLLAPDFVKLNWSPEFHNGIPSVRLADMRDVIGHLGAERMVLARVDSEDAIRWGLELGITSFQGHLIDRLVERMAGQAAP